MTTNAVAERSGTPAPAPRAPQAPVVVWKNMGVLRGAAISLVVLSHAMRPQGDFIYKTAAAWETEPFFAFYQWALLNIPSFVFVSAYFMGRFSNNWTAAKGGARQVLGRYLLWTTAHFVTLWIVGAHLELVPTAWAILSGSGRPHWFLVLIIQLYLLTPLVYPWVKRNPRAALGVALPFQIFASGVYYLRRSGIDSPFHLEFILMQVPFFLLGLWASVNTDRIVEWLVARKKWVRLAAVGGVGLQWAESRVLWVFTPAITYYLETFGLVLAAAAIVAWTMTWQSKVTPVRNALNYIGLRSFGIFLVHDYIIKAGVVAFWHFERVLGLTTRPRTEVPLWFFGHLWSVVPLFIAGLCIPLLLIETVERLGGKRVRTAIFG